MSNIECLVHNNSPIMFICLDNNCRQKLFCFKCCQQYRKEHTFVKFTDFMQNLETLSQNQFIKDSNQVSTNSTQKQEKEDLQNSAVIQQNQPQNQPKSSEQSQDNLILQCFQGINGQLRREIVQEESEKLKQNLQFIQVEYINELFDHTIQELAKSLDNARQKITNKLIQYLETTLNADAAFSHQNNAKVAQIILEINQTNNYEQLNDSLINLHQGQYHLQKNQEKIADKLGELNQKLDEFCVQIQNRITFGLNSCINIFQSKQVNAATAAAIKKMFQSNIIQKNQPGEYRFSLRQPKNFNTILQNQITYQSSLINTGQNSSNQGNSQRISFRIKNQNQKKIDNVQSLSPQSQQQKTKSNSIISIQGNKISPLKYSKQIITEPSQNTLSPKNQFQNTFFLKKKSTFHTKEEETNDLKKLFPSQSRDETCVGKQQQKKPNQSNGQAVQQKLCDGALLNQYKLNHGKVQNLKFSQNNYEKPLYIFQNDYKMPQEDNFYSEQQQKSQQESNIHSNFSQQLQQPKQVYQLQLLKKSPKNENLINYKLESNQTVTIDPMFDDTNIQNSMVDENSKMQEKSQTLFNQFKTNLNNNFVDNFQSINYFQRNSNQIQHVVDSQKQMLKQKSDTESCSLVIINQSDDLFDYEDEHKVISNFNNQQNQFEVQLNTPLTNDSNYTNFTQNINQFN